MKYHPIAELFPMLSKPELESLADDIKRNGQLHPITIYEDLILDGRNRWEACKLAGVEAKSKEFKGDDPLSFVISANLTRRHLSESQRAMVAARLANLELGDNQHKSGSANLPTLNVSQPEAAKLLNVSTRSVTAAKSIQKQSPELAFEIDSGKMTINEANRTIKRQQQAAKIAKSKKVKLGETIKGPFDLILADPPWKYEHCEADNREIENQYPTATLEEIFKHSPQSGKDSILLLWATAPKLEEAMQVMKSWGFNYRSCAVWDKTVIGMGYWFRIQHELLLIGVKGKPKCTPESERISSIFTEKRGKHSVKPECVYQWIESAFPDLKKLEMYCRSPRPNWAVWGNEL